MHLRFILAFAFAGAAPCVVSAQPAALPAQDSLTITLRITDARTQPAPQQRSDARTPVPLQVQALTPAPPAQAAATLVTVTY